MKGLSFLDTKILVYAFAQTEDDRHAKAKALVMDLLAEHNACASVQVLKEFHAVATKKAAAPLSRRDAAGIIRDLCISCHITDETVQQLRRALDLIARYGISIWDASIVAAAEAAGCVRLYSEDLADGTALGTVRIINPLALPKAP
jgi:predicted nucleic acid-binding protein